MKTNRTSARILTTLVPTALGVLSLALGGAALASTVPADLSRAGSDAGERHEVQRPTVNLAICLDTSGSMDGLIDATRRSIWGVVNDLALAKPTPDFRIAFLTFGNDGHDEATGWVKIHAPMTDDLDLISQSLFAQSTNGGTELVARVVDRAVNTLDWSNDPAALKIIIVAGNEGADQDTEISYRDACRRAIANGIMVNSIYCGSPADAEAQAWREVSMLADGSFATIDQNLATVEIPTPFDKELVALNESINKTYIAYGAKGDDLQERQWAEDANAQQLGAAASASRLACKSGDLYSNSQWDLIDACGQDVVDLETIDEAQLPEEMRSMSLEERKAFVQNKQEARDALTAQVETIVPKRDAFVAKEKVRMAIDDSKSLGSVLRKAIRAQAVAKGVHIPEPPPAAPAAVEAEASTKEVAGGG